MRSGITSNSGVLLRNLFLPAPPAQSSQLAGVLSRLLGKFPRVEPRSSAVFLQRVQAKDTSGGHLFCSWSSHVGGTRRKNTALALKFPVQ